MKALGTDPMFPSGSLGPESQQLLFAGALCLPSQEPEQALQLLSLFL
jgi:hypothetical protein